MYRIVFSLLAERQFFKLDKQIQRRIIKILERIRMRPEAYVRKLVGDQGYRLRVGEYRVIVDIQGETLTILVIKIGHRKTIYK